MRMTMTDSNGLSIQTDLCCKSPAKAEEAAAPAFAFEDTWMSTDPSAREAMERSWAQGLEAPSKAQPPRRISSAAVRVALGVGAAACIISAIRGASADGLISAAGARSYPYVGLDANGTSYGINTLLYLDFRGPNSNSGDTHQAGALLQNIASCTNYTQVATQGLNFLLGSSGKVGNAALLFASKVDPTDAVQTCIRKFVGWPIAF